MLVEIGRLAFEMRAEDEVRALLDELFGRFRIDVAAQPPIELELSHDAPLSPSWPLGRSGPAVFTLRLARGVIEIEGGARGWLDPSARRAQLAGITNLGEIDALVRLALAVLLPAEGALLFHGAAVTTPGGVMVLVGESGSGKSTAAAHLQPSLADELVVLRPLASGGVEVTGTPYWGGRPASHPVARLVCLRRGLPPHRVARHGAAAVRALLPHVVRYLAHPTVDVQALSLVARLGASPVLELACPEGAAYLPFLTRALAEATR
jgi:hypothetical protein